MSFFTGPVWSIKRIIETQYLKNTCWIPSPINSQTLTSYGMSYQRSVFLLNLIEKRSLLTRNLHIFSSKHLNALNDVRTKSNNKHRSQSVVTLLKCNCWKESAVWLLTYIKTQHIVVIGINNVLFLLWIVYEIV